MIVFIVIVCNFLWKC